MKAEAAEDSQNIFQIEFSPEMRQKLLIGGHHTMDDVFQIFDLVQAEVRKSIE